MFRKIVGRALLLTLLGGCALYSDVAIKPLQVLPTNIDRGADMQQMLRKSDYLRAMEAAANFDTRTRHNPDEMTALGNAFLAAGRYDEARTRLRAALDMKPYRTAYAEIAWNLSQVEYLANNYEASYEWAQIATDNGLSIRQWHLDYLAAMSKVPAYKFSGAAMDRVPMRFGRPDVPRVEVKVNGTRDVPAIIDSGAVLSIVSRRFADEVHVKTLGTFKGTFYGLLGEPIAVDFGLLQSIDIGDIHIENVPVAIMPDEKMRFLISEKEKREFRMDCLLGANLLKEFRLALDFGRSSATFTKLSPHDRIADPKQNIFFAGFRPYVRGTINGKGWFMFVLDTGSEITFLNEKRVDSLPIHFMAVPRAHNAMLQGLGGSKKRGAKLEQIEVGVDRWSGQFRTLPMYSSEDKESAVGIIGQNLLKHFTVIIDFGRMRLDLERR
ncbi:MAG TPA: aspartyl protease family protein [Thermoanaerobaculia bacterium]|nr:aspartyl protease family protein [Thermoanaerobaculia bacterium]